MEVLAQKERLEELKTQWRRLWRERIDDKVRAEGIANLDYSMMFVERGTVVFATRDFRWLSFKDILERHGMLDKYGLAPPDPQVGGWHKFIRTSIAHPSARRHGRVRRTEPDFGNGRHRQQLKKGGRGWLHV